MLIRQATPGDAAAIHRLHVGSIRGLCASWYTPAQMVAWTAALARDRYVEAMRTQEFYVGEADDGTLLGFVIADVGRGELAALYVSVRAARTGVGRQLLTFVEDLARARGVAALALRATLNAAPFYGHLGFRPIGATVHTLPSGVGLPCVEMVKAL